MPEGENFSEKKLKFPPIMVMPPGADGRGRGSWGAKSHISSHPECRNQRTSLLYKRRSKEGTELFLRGPVISKKGGKKGN